MWTNNLLITYPITTRISWLCFMTLLLFIFFFFFLMIFIHTLGMRERWTSSPPLLNCWCCLGFSFRVFLGPLGHKSRGVSEEQSQSWNMDKASWVAVWTISIWGPFQYGPSWVVFVCPQTRSFFTIQYSKFLPIYMPHPTT